MVWPAQDADQRRGAAVLVLLLIGTIASGGDDPSPNAAATPTTNPSSTATARTPTTTPSDPEPEPSTKRKAEPKGSSAKFKHFTVMVRDVRRETPSEVRMLAKVCVGTSLPPDPQGTGPGLVGIPGQSEPDHRR